MKIDVQQAGALLVLHGWLPFFYLTPFEQDSGYGLRHLQHGVFRTATGKVITRHSAMPEGWREVTMDEIPAHFMRPLYARISGLGYVPKLGNDPAQLEYGYD
jgi:hypothetical protein